MISLAIEVLISVAGLAAAGFFLVIGLTNRSRSYVRTGVMVLVATIVIVAGGTLIEFLLKG